MGGAPIKDYAVIKSYFTADDYYIFCDSGLYHEKELGVTPSLIVGDFDSHERPQRDDIETVVLPCEKDDTDTGYAVKEAIKRGYRDFLFVGVIGARLDHSLGNIALLNMLFDERMNAVAVDDYSEIEVVGNAPKTVPDSFSYFSLLTVSGKAKGVTVQNAKYPLKGAVITPSDMYGVSNEPLNGGTSVCVANGRLLLIKVR